MSEPKSSDRRLYGIVVVVGIVAGGVMIWAASRTWASVEVAPPGMTVDDVDVTGSTAVPLVSAMSFVVMAGSVAVVAAGGWLRRAVGVVIALAAAGALVAGVLADAAIDDAVRDAVAASTSMTGDAGQEDALVAAADHSLWRWAAVVASLVGVAVGCLVVAYAPRWPRMGKRYEAPGARTARAADSTPAEDRDVGDLWKALDEGDDPTV
ncbi:Trp biosynthesis-associated membrane protein [Solicola gregarius]|uniref:Trp biosynthesis-associated membrane protein n=1 Tax=Solicola gregarius TaxID=2908642 RepID=A0AA46THC0_9ACTN|nr:Trp biosynthesis-associated membrane protein [Solicola gregarius]UYM05326.1 Trp biosynthesis-associated membrane protein [Solicola gregarius]